MKFEEFQVFITPLAMHFGAVKDVPTWRLYHAALFAPPAPSRALLERTLTRSANRRFFPSTEEFRADAEVERQALLKAHPYQRCEACRDASGFVTTVDAAGVERVTKCACFSRYRTGLAQLGVGDEPVSMLLLEGEL